MSLEPKQIDAAKLLAKGQSQTQTAQAIGVSRRTIVRWLSQSEFKNLCFGLSGEVQAVAKSVNPIDLKSQVQVRNQPNNLTVDDLVPYAVQAIQEILTSPDVRPSDRLKAAALVGQWSGLEYRGKTQELEAFKLLGDANLLPGEMVERVEEVILGCFRNIRSVTGVQEEGSFGDDESWLGDLELEENA